MKIEKTQLGKTDLKVTKIAFGAWVIGGWNWGGTDEKVAKETVRAAYETGMTTIDTAPIYGFGQSERVIGTALREVPRDSYEILTKYGIRWDTDRGVKHADTKDMNGKDISVYRYSSADSVIEECEASLRRLQTDYIDLYQIHVPDASTPIEETMEAVNKLMKQGKVRAAGVSNYDTEEMNEALKYIDVASNQVPYSMVRRGIEKDVIPLALEKNISILPYSPLQRGVLTGKITADTVFREGDTRADSKYFTAENIQKIKILLEQIRPIAEGYEVTLAQLVLNWTAHQPGVTSVLAGARSSSQVRNNALALSFTLTESEMQMINSAVADYNGVKDE